MNDNLDPQLENLFTSARAQGPFDTSRVEFGFETRLLARLREERGSSIFVRAWKLCPFFAAIAIAAGIWCRSTNARVQVDASLIAEAARRGDEQLFVSFLTGDRP